MTNKTWVVSFEVKGVASIEVEAPDELTALWNAKTEITLANLDDWDIVASSGEAVLVDDGAQTDGGEGA